MAHCCRWARYGGWQDGCLRGQSLPNETTNMSLVLNFERSGSKPERLQWAWVIRKWQDFPQPDAAIPCQSISRLVMGSDWFYWHNPLAGISQMVEFLYFKASAWHAAWRFFFWLLSSFWIRRDLGRPAIWNWRRSFIWSTLQVASSCGHQHELDQLCASCSWAASLPSSFVVRRFLLEFPSLNITEHWGSGSVFKHQTYSRHFPKWWGVGVAFTKYRSSTALFTEIGLKPLGLFF